MLLDFLTKFSSRTSDVERRTGKIPESKRSPIAQSLWTANDLPMSYSSKILKQGRSSGISAGRYSDQIGSLSSMLIQWLGETVWGAADSLSRDQVQCDHDHYLSTSADTANWNLPG